MAMVASISGTDVLGVLFVFGLFLIFILTLSLLVLLPVWIVQRWYAPHRLRKLPWRSRRALIGLALLWSAVFSKLSRWKKVVGITGILSLLMVVFLIWLNAGLYADSLESITIHDLRRGRFSWLYEGCEYPPDAERHVGGNGGSWIIYTHTNAHQIDGRTYHGLFAMREKTDATTYVVTTTDEILVFTEPGRPRLLKKAGKW